MKIYQTLLLTSLIMTLLVACIIEPGQPETFTIGIVNLTSTLDPVLAGFKAGMADLGYVEGEHVTYLYDGLVGLDDLDAAIQDLLAADVDLIFSLGTAATLKTKQAVAGTDIPVVFAPVNDPVESGIVASVIEPGVNLTGVRTRGGIAKSLEWHLAVAPNARRIFVPHNPNDNGSVQSLAQLQSGATKLDIDLVIQEVGTPDELRAALTTMPADVQAIYLLSSSFLTKQADKFIEVALERRLPLSTGTNRYKTGALLSYSPDIFEIGKQTSGLAAQILQGTSPAELRVETADFLLGINLQTAEAIGLDIPDDVLDQADDIVH